MLTTLIISLASVVLVSSIEGANTVERVVNGVEAIPHSYPWQLSLRYGSGHTCGAVVYNSMFAITAAHCVHNSRAEHFSVWCGAHDISVSPEEGRQISGVEHIMVHPEYDPEGYGFPNDVAVLKLKTPLKIMAECQPGKLDDGTIDFDFTPANITGWGRIAGGERLANKLKQGHVEALTDWDCRWFCYRCSGFAHLCVMDADEFYGGCNGDSGGPAHVGDVVVGLASFVWGNCMTNYPTVYAKISSYVPWIEETVSEMS